MGSWSVKTGSVLLVLLFSQQSTFAQNVEYFGRYIIERVQILKNDLSTTLPHEDLAVRVRLQSSRVILELEGGAENEAMVFHLLRKEEIRNTKNDGEEILSGIKAFQNINGVIKHLLLTQESLQITSFVPNSDITRITYAKRGL